MLKPGVGTSGRHYLVQSEYCVCRRTFTLDLPGTLAFDHPTATALTAFITSRLGDAQQQPSVVPTSAVLAADRCALHQTQDTADAAGRKQCSTFATSCQLRTMHDREPSPRTGLFELFFMQGAPHKHGCLQLSMLGHVTKDHPSLGTDQHCIRALVRLLAGPSCHAQPAEPLEKSPAGKCAANTHRRGLDPVPEGCYTDA